MEQEHICVVCLLLIYCTETCKLKLLYFLETGKVFFSVLAFIQVTFRQNGDYFSYYLEGSYCVNNTINGHEQ